MVSGMTRNSGELVKMLQRISLIGLRNLIPSFFPYSMTQDMTVTDQKLPTSHILGFRGLVMVVIFLERFLSPFMSNFIRVESNDTSTSAVTINSMFALLLVSSGYLAASKSVRFASKGLWEDAFNSLLRWTARRLMMLLIPALVSTYMLMLWVRFPLWESDAFDGSTQPIRQTTIWAQHLDWIKFNTSFLLSPTLSPAKFPVSNYGRHLWIIPLELKAIFMSVVAMLVLCRSRPKVAILVSAIISLLAMVFHHDSYSLVLIGITIAVVEIEANGLRNSSRKLFGLSIWKLLSPVCLFLGILSTSYSWHHHANKTSSWEFIFMPNSHLYLNAGAILIVGAVCFQSLLQPWLHLRVIEYLGCISNSLFILHEPLLHTFGWKVSFTVYRATKSIHGSLQALCQVVGFFLVAALVVCMADCFYRLVEMPSIELACWLENRLWEASSQNDETLDFDDSLSTADCSSGLISEEFLLPDLKEFRLVLNWKKGPLSYTTGCRLRGLALVYTVFGVLVVGSCLLTVYLEEYSIGLDNIYKGKYIRYNIPDHHQGPRFQEFLTPENVTNWLPSHLALSDFATRLDDQTLYPKTESSEFEVRIRDWFLRHYPDLDDIYREGLHLNKTYLSPPRSQREIILDDRFHITHCVVFWRRYFKSLTEGRHTTPRDMDLGHLDHCLHSLEQFTMDDRMWTRMENYRILVRIKIYKGADCLG